MTRIVVFTDLDHTLFQSAERCRAWGAPAASWTLAAYDRRGRPHAFQVPAQRALLTLLRGCPLIPVTGRNGAALARVCDPRFDYYRIVSHGGMIYRPDGAVLADWFAWVAPQARAQADILAALAARLAADYPAAEVRVVHDAGLPMYVALRCAAAGACPNTAELRVYLPSSDWYLQSHGRSMALLPPYVRKATAVARVIASERDLYGETCFLALGDSEADLGFLNLCDFAVIPRHAQLRMTWPC